MSDPLASTGARRRWPRSSLLAAPAAVTVAVLLAAILLHAALPNRLSAARAAALWPGSTAAAQAAAAPPNLAFSPSPIAPPGSLGSGRQITVTLAATEGGRPTGSRKVWLSFRQAAGGGMALAGGRSLTVNPQPFATGEDGTLTVVYTTPPVAPPVQEDLILAQDELTNPTATARTWYAFGPQYEFSPPTIAPAGGLAPGGSVTVTLTVRSNGSPRSNEPVYLSLRRTAGGGSASAGADLLTEAPQPFATDPLGRIAVTYTAPATPPSAGNDYIVAQNARNEPAVEARAVYGFGPRLDFTPSLIARAGSLAPGQTVPVTLTARDGAGAALPGATVHLWISRAAAGGAAAVAGAPLNDLPRPFAADSEGRILVDYTAPADPATVGRDLLFAQNSAEQPGVVAAAWYDFAPQYRFSATPIAPASSLRPGQSAAVTLTVLAQGAPLPEASVYLWLIRGADGGGADAAGTQLTGAPQPFTADSAGQIPIIYRAPAAPAAFGNDYVVAQNSAVSAAAGNYTWYSYGLRYDFSAAPVAPAGTLGPGQSAPLTLTVQRAGAPLPGATVFLSLAGAAGGGTAAVEGAALHGAPQPFVTDASGQIAIAYTTPDRLPDEGADSIIAQDAPTEPLVAAVSRYGFGPRYVWLSDAIAPPGSLRAGQTVTATLTVRGASGRPAPGATALLSLLSVGPGGSAAVGEVRLTTTPRPFAADRNGVLQVTYRAPSGPAAGHDYLMAQSHEHSPAARSFAWYGFGPRYEFSPSPLAPTGSLPAGRPVTATLTVSSGGDPLANSTVYLALRGGPGGGSAAVRGTALTGAPQPFLTDASGQIAIRYAAPNASPSGGLDEIVAQDAASEPSVTATAGYTYGPRYEFSPSPIAAPGALAAGQTATVTLAVSSGGLARGGATVYVSLAATGGGGSAAVEGQPLTAAPQPFTAARDGRLTIHYTAPAALPGLGADTITAQSAPEHPAVRATVRYAFGPVLAFSPAPIAAPAALTPGQSVALTLTAASNGTPLPHTPVFLWFSRTPGGGAAAVGGAPISSAPQPYLTDAHGEIALSYTAPATPPAAGVDFILAQERAADPAALAWNWYSFAAP